jgi:hypothetical protein
MSLSLLDYVLKKEIKNRKNEGREYSVESDKIALEETDWSYYAEYFYCQEETEEIKNALTIEELEVCFYTKLLVYEKNGDTEPIREIDKLIFNYKGELMESFLQFEHETEKIAFDTRHVGNRTSANIKELEPLKQILINHCKYRIQFTLGEYQV